MPIRGKCPGCGVALNVPDEFAEKVVKCGKCGMRFKVPPAPPPMMEVDPPANENALPPEIMEALSEEAPAESEGGSRFKSRSASPSHSAQPPAQKPWSTAMIIVVVFAAVQLGAFFLPWIDAGIFSISGHQIPSKMRALASFAERSARAPILTKTQILSLNLLYVLPLLAIIAGVIHMARAGNAAKTSFSCGLLSALIVVGVPLYFHYDVEEGFKLIGDALGAMAIGFYWEVAASIGLCVASRYVKRR